MKQHPNLDDGTRLFTQARPSKQQQEIDLFLLEHGGPGPRFLYWFSFLGSWLKQLASRPKPRQAARRGPRDAT